MRILPIVALSLATYGGAALAAPFDTCPSKAYLFQSNPVQVYGLNLVTGQSTLIQSDTGMDVNINGVGFDFENRYIYGYDTTNKQIVRLGHDFQAEIVNTANLPTGHTFYVGDVHDQYYYLYRTGKGLFRIDLRPLESDPTAILLVEQISSSASPKLTDFAFHPGDGSLYGIDNNSGGLYRFNTSTGAETYIGDTGELGTFGAGYFDVNGYYYVSRNQDGQVYRIDLSDDAQIAAGNVPAVKFADGPSSSQNDGARCANAPVIDEDSTIDFGDAPDSYQTTLASNGPRHQIDGMTWLGNSVPDGEQDGFVSPLSDNTSGSNDEDGIGFVTALETGFDSIIIANASISGYLSAWIDWNQDGDFDDENEKVFSDKELTAGVNQLLLNVDINALNGNTWARFRFSQQTGLNYNGGSTSGEVEDYQINVLNDGATARYFPSEFGYATLAYEDNWPYTADYDMNDVVMFYHITEIVKENKVVKSTIKGRFAAYGADYKNGFAVRLAGLSRSEIDTARTFQQHNGAINEDSGLELDANEAIFIISNDLTSKFSTNCSYYRTINSCKDSEAFAFNLSITLKEDADVSSLMGMPYDPFIFASPGTYHGQGLPNHPGRSYEIHLADQAPTEKFDTDNLAGLGVDVSDESSGVYFKTATNLPWALLITDEWEWPTERTDLVTAYPSFAEYAQSGGSKNTDWFESSNAIQNKYYQP